MPVLMVEKHAFGTSNGIDVTAVRRIGSDGDHDEYAEKKEASLSRASRAVRVECGQHVQKDLVDELEVFYRVETTNGIKASNESRLRGAWVDVKVMQCQHKIDFTDRHGSFADECAPNYRHGLKLNSSHEVKFISCFIGWNTEAHGDADGPESRHKNNSRLYCKSYEMNPGDSRFSASATVKQSIDRVWDSHGVGSLTGATLLPSTSYVHLTGSGLDVPHLYPFIADFSAASPSSRTVP
ncbi:hypothetical protein B0H17DRAFT_1127648 [Mycena rosella]|uniref:Uncharacterized protein n=1 Tax=Mycena rosella TaxID=1033263 RepID=A0AAD7GQ77_MYCRO|nr:hypothetical protein B0H17DRAFT_1127648 [Mycena rosella]